MSGHWPGRLAVGFSVWQAKTSRKEGTLGACSCHDFELAIAETLICWASKVLLTQISFVPGPPVLSRPNPTDRHHGLPVMQPSRVATVRNYHGLRGSRHRETAETASSQPLPCTMSPQPSAHLNSRSGCRAETLSFLSFQLRHHKHNRERSPRVAIFTDWVVSAVAHLPFARANHEGIQRYQTWRGLAEPVMSACSSGARRPATITNSTMRAQSHARFCRRRR